MKKFFPTFLTILIGAMTALSPDIQGTISQHPNLGIGLITAYTILKGLLPSPISKGSAK